MQRGLDILDMTLVTETTYELCHTGRMEQLEHLKYVGELGLLGLLGALVKLVDVWHTFVTTGNIFALLGLLETLHALGLSTCSTLYTRTWGALALGSLASQISLMHLRMKIFMGPRAHASVGFWV